MKSVGFKGKNWNTDSQDGLSGQSRVTRVPHLNAITPARAAPGRRCPARMGRRAGFCLNSLLAQREEKMAAEVGGEPEFEILVFLILGLQPPWRMVKRER